MDDLLKSKANEVFISVHMALFVYVTQILYVACTGKFKGREGAYLPYS